MPTETKVATWKWVVGYVAFGLVALLVGLELTFPYDALRERIVSEAANNGVYVKMASLGPGLLGMTASKVELSRKMEPNEEKPPPALMVDSVTVRPSLFPLGVAVRARLLHGTVAAAVGVLGDLKVRAQVDDLNLQDDNLKAFSGVALAGHANGQISLDLPKTSPSKSQPAEPDLSQAGGTISLDFTDLQINGGTVTVPYMGQPTPFDLPKIGLGDLEAKVKFEKGLGTIDKLHAKSDDLELMLTGTLKLSKRVDFSEPNIILKLKAQPEFVKRLGMIGAGLSMLEPDRDNPEFRSGHLTGFLSRPNFNPR